MRTTLRLLITVCVAGIINFLIFFALTILSKPVTNLDEEEIRNRVLIPLETLVEEPEVIEPEPEESPEPEIMEVELNFDQPIPDFRPIDMDLALNLPSISQVKAKRPTRPTKSTSNMVLTASEEPQEAEAIDSPPRELATNRDPIYPRFALTKGLEGKVSVRILIDENGTIEDVKIVEHEGYERFRTAVLSAIKSWRFTRPYHHGRPVKVWGTKTFNFELRGGFR